MLVAVVAGGSIPSTTAGYEPVRRVIPEASEQSQIKVSWALIWSLFGWISFCFLLMHNNILRN